MLRAPCSRCGEHLHAESAMLAYVHEHEAEVVGASW